MSGYLNSQIEIMHLKFEYFENVLTGWFPLKHACLSFKGEDILWSWFLCHFSFLLELFYDWRLLCSWILSMYALTCVVQSAHMSLLKKIVLKYKCINQYEQGLYETIVFPLCLKEL